MPRDEAVPFEYFYDTITMMRIQSKDIAPSQWLLDVIREADSEAVRGVRDDSSGAYSG